MPRDAYVYSLEDLKDAYQPGVPAFHDGNVDLTEGTAPPVHMLAAVAARQAHDNEQAATSFARGVQHEHDETDAGEQDEGDVSVGEDGDSGDEHGSAYVQSDEQVGSPSPLADLKHLQSLKRSCASDAGSDEERAHDDDAQNKGNSNKLRRTRKVLSCRRCRIRKIRCSREKQCKSCTARGVDCVWEVGAFPLGDAETANENDVNAEVDRLRQIVRHLCERIGLAEEDIEVILRPTNARNRRAARKGKKQDVATSQQAHRGNTPYTSSRYSQQRQHAASGYTHAFGAAAPPDLLVDEAGVELGALRSPLSDEQPAFAMPPTPVMPPGWYAGPSSASTSVSQPSQLRLPMTIDPHYQQKHAHHQMHERLAPVTAYPHGMVGFPGMYGTSPVAAVPGQSPYQSMWESTRSGRDWFASYPSGSASWQPKSHTAGAPPTPSS